MSEINIEKLKEKLETLTDAEIKDLALKTLISREQSNLRKKRFRQSRKDNSKNEI